MIVLPEQYGYKNPRPFDGESTDLSVLTKKKYNRTIQRGSNPAYCYNITYSENELNPYRFETSYFVGVDWIVEKQLAICVDPKLNTEDVNINYTQMLIDALSQTSNLKHLDQLYTIDFYKPAIQIKQRQDFLSPFLLVLYLKVLSGIVQRGLKKSYYKVTENLNAKVKGRILVGATVKKNHYKNQLLKNYCQYTEFGLNSTENKILKKALGASISALQNIRGFDTSHLRKMLNYIRPAFAQVDDQVNIRDLKMVKSNKIYKDYDHALNLAKTILRQQGYNISNTSLTKVHTPPFWIDMSKLFELYVFAKLKEAFPLRGEVVYHKTFNYLEPDFILKSKDGKYKMVVDAKYKPQYKDKVISKEDIRQISGYARLKSIHEYLKVEEDKVVDCLVIYSNQNSNRTTFLEEDFQLTPSKNYVHFFKIGIQLPIDPKAKTYD